MLHLRMRIGQTEEGSLPKVNAVTPGTTDFMLSTGNVLGQFNGVKLIIGSCKRWKQSPMWNGLEDRPLHDMI